MAIDWVECGEHTAYPVLNVRFTHGRAGEVWSFLFDTGADNTYINFEVLENENISIEGLTIITARCRGKYFEFVELPIAVILIDGRRKAGGQATIRAVINWEDSPFKGNCKPGVCLDHTDVQSWCAPRNALLSPKILKDTRATVTLKGDSSVSSLT